MPGKARMPLANGATTAKRSVRSSREKRDEDIMGTNDSSIVSKRSVCKLYFPGEPDFYEPFVGKYVRRNPLINRGYWLRMHAVEQVVRRFLEENTEKSKIVVNLGCGYDPLPFQFWHRYPSICAHATFVDVDYGQLVERKRDRILANDVLREALLHTRLRPSVPPVYLRSERYMAVGCDLRDLSTLENKIKAELDITSSSILFIAEVSLTYMPVNGSDALIRWASTFTDARFCLLEQYLPQGPEHPFARTMLQHFDKLQTPIYAVQQYPSLDQQVERFISAGWFSTTIARNLWDLWNDEQFSPPQLRRSLDTIEPFDEWEEFALFAGHYFLIVATTDRLTIADKDGSKLSGTDHALSSDTPCLQPLTLALQRPAAELALTYRRFGAACALQKDLVAIHGGQGVQHRLGTLDMLSRGSCWADMQRPSSCLGPVPQARICNTITAFHETDALLVGGRTSPSQALADCWHLHNGEWRATEPLHPPRFRHCSVKVKLEPRIGDACGVLVFGGKTSTGDLLEDWVLWKPSQGWQTLHIRDPHPSARFGAAISTTEQSQDWGLLVGGMNADGTVVEDIWEWHISSVPTLHMTFVNRTQDVRHGARDHTYARFGASLLPLGHDLLLIGGVSGKGVQSLSEDFLSISTGPLIRIEQPGVTVSNDIWPLLVGFGSVAVSPDEIILAGGGAVCFSMGSFWNTGIISISTPGSGPLHPWTLFSHGAERLPSAQPTALAQKLKPVPKSKAKDQTRAQQNKRARDLPIAVSRVRVASPADFESLLARAQPAILEGLNMGPCTTLWNLPYLKEKIGPDREIIVHECESDRMTFKDKNFEYVRRSFGDFIDGIESGSKMYLRAVSANQPNKQPTKLEDDFPAIAEDFCLPDELAHIKERYHSSPLRISGPVSLWLHYDVLANVLCQIIGKKSLRLYPPGDVKYLDFPPGGSSSNTNVLASTNPNLKHTHPHIANLKPGDILYIPPLWAHTASPEEGVSVAVNVFFRNLEHGYAAGKDVYGNRDLQAYENGRRDVDRILKAFKGLPEDVSKFYLDRLAGELQEKADRIGAA